MKNSQIYKPGQYYWKVKAIKEKRNANISKLHVRGISLLMNDSVIESISSPSTSLLLIPVIDNNSKIGFVSDICEIVVEPSYDKIIGSFWGKDNIVAVQNDNKWNVIDSDGKLLLKEWLKYKIVPSRDSRMITINSKAIMNVDDTDSFQYIKNIKNVKSVGGFRYGFARIHRNGGWGLINEKGEEILPAIYEEMYSYDDYPEPTTRVRRNKESKLELIQLNDLR